MRATQGEFDPSWGLEPTPSMKVSVPIVSDTLVENLRSQTVRTTPGVKRITGPATVELENGEELEVDTIVCCTGFRNDYSILDPRFDPSANPPEEWLAAPGSKGRPLPRLYQNVFSLSAPDSLAFLGSVWFATGAFFLADVASMCITQVWAGHSHLPPQPKMEGWADRHSKEIIALANRGSPLPASVASGEWLAWADKTAGTGLYSHIGWGWEGWLFWMRKRRLWKMIMDGPLTSAAWRLFDEGKRKPWDGARETIERVNKEVEQARAKKTR